MKCPEGWAEQAFEKVWAETLSKCSENDRGAVEMLKPLLQETAVGAYKAGFSTAMMQIDITGIFAKNA